MDKNVTNLINGCRKNDSVSQLHLFELFLPYVTSVCKRYLRNRSLLKDVVQEVFLLVFKGINRSFDEQKGDFKAWVRKIAINTCLNFNARYRNFIELDSQFETTEYQIIASAIHQISKKEILKLIDSIPDAYRDVFNLFAIDGYSHKEIAFLLKINEDSSRKKLQRARAFLKKNIEEERKINLIKAG